MHLLIIIIENETLGKCSKAIQRCLQQISPHPRMEELLITDQRADKSKILCDKVVFLITKQSASQLQPSVSEWVSVLPKIHSKELNHFILEWDNGGEAVEPEAESSEHVQAKAVNSKAQQENTDSTEVDIEKLEEGLYGNSNKVEGDIKAKNADIDEADEQTSNKKSKGKEQLTVTNAAGPSIEQISFIKGTSLKNIIKVKDFGEECFSWWPKVLQFLFGRCSAPGGLENYFEQNPYRLYTLPNCVNNIRNFYENTDPNVKAIKAMLKGYDLFRVAMSKKEVPCVLVVATSQSDLPSDILAVTDPKKAKVLTLALHGTVFSDEIKGQSSKTFTPAQKMEFIFNLMMHLKIINTKSHQRKLMYDVNVSNFKATELKILGIFFFILTLPAAILQLSVASVIPWPLCIRYKNEEITDEETKTLRMNIGFGIVAVLSFILTILSECLWFPQVTLHTEVPISVWVTLYLILWQIMAHWMLINNGFKYGVFSIPSVMFKLAMKRQQISPVQFFY